jgi:recombinational DNA repair protein (RecF pathway)
MNGKNFLEKKLQKHLEYMFYSSTFAPAIERDSGDEMLRNIKKLFKKNFEKYLELNNKSYYLCIRVCLR